MEKIIKEGKSIEAALSALMEENNLSKEEQETLNNQIAKPLLMLSNLSNEETAKQIKMQIISSMQESSAKSIKEGDYALPGYPSTSGISPEILEQMSLIEILKVILSNVKLYCDGFIGNF